MEEKAIRDMITKDSFCNRSIEDLIEQLDGDSGYLNVKPSELKYSTPQPFGEYEVVEYREWVVVYSKDTQKAKAVMTVYELHGYEILPEKEMLLIYGHEEIVLYFMDGTSKMIRTR